MYSVQFPVFMLGGHGRMGWEGDGPGVVTWEDGVGG